MRNILTTAAFVLWTAGALQAQSIVGDWQGTLKAGGAELRVALHVTRGDDGGLKATMDSLDQGAMGIPITSIAVKDSTLTFTVDAVQGSYQGKIQSDGAAIDGTWTQLGMSLPLVFKPVKNAAALLPRRPQVPTKPYPYREEEVAYDNQTAGISLAGSLTIPAGQGPFPAVVLITGSGPQDRDESLMGHRPFLVLADYLTRRGIVVLRADDRGVGKSGGNFGYCDDPRFCN